MPNSIVTRTLIISPFPQMSIALSAFFTGVIVPFRLLIEFEILLSSLFEVYFKIENFSCNAFKKHLLPLYVFKTHSVLRHFCIFYKNKN